MRNINQIFTILISNIFFAAVSLPSPLSAQDLGIITGDVIEGVVVGNQTGGTIIVGSGNSQYKVLDGNRVKILAPGEEKIRHYCQPMSDVATRSQFLDIKASGAQFTKEQLRKEARGMMHFVDEKIFRGRPFITPGGLGYLGGLHLDGKGNVYKVQADGAYQPTKDLTDSVREANRREFKRSGIPNNYLSFIDYEVPDVTPVEIGPVVTSYEGVALYVNLDGRFEAALKLVIVAKEGSVKLTGAVAYFQELFECVSF